MADADNDTGHSVADGAQGHTRPPAARLTVPVVFLAVVQLLLQVFKPPTPAVPSPVARVIGAFAAFTVLVIVGTFVACASGEAVRWWRLRQRRQPPPVLLLLRLVLLTVCLVVTMFLPAEHGLALVDFYLLGYWFTRLLGDRYRDLDVPDPWCRVACDIVYGFVVVLFRDRGDGDPSDDKLNQAISAELMPGPEAAESPNPTAPSSADPKNTDPRRERKVETIPQEVVVMVTAVFALLIMLPTFVPSHAQAFAHEQYTRPINAIGSVLDGNDPRPAPATSSSSSSSSSPSSSSSQSGADQDGAIPGGSVSPPPRPTNLREKDCGTADIFVAVAGLTDVKYVDRAHSAGAAWELFGSRVIGCPKRFTEEGDYLVVWFELPAVVAATDPLAAIAVRGGEDAVVVFPGYATSLDSLLQRGFVPSMIGARRDTDRGQYAIFSSSHECAMTLLADGASQVLGLPIDVTHLLLTEASSTDSVVKSVSIDGSEYHFTLRRPISGEIREFRIVDQGSVARERRDDGTFAATSRDECPRAAAEHYDELAGAAHDEVAPN